MKIAILSDIHGNENALQKVLQKIYELGDVEGIVLLGDLIDYGPHSNEVISMIENVNIDILCNLWGNHEQAILLKVWDRFSSERGVSSAKYTMQNLQASSLHYLDSEMNKNGFEVLTICGKKCLAVHGSLKDYFWKSIDVLDDLAPYEEFDYVFSGHSHVPVFYEKFYKCDNELMRNKKKTIFINPGSVGQPRNHNCFAQYALLDFERESIEFVKVEYDIEKEINAFSNEVDSFYKERLLIGV